MGRRCCVTDQLLATVDVFRAMYERVLLCQDPQTEFVLIRESLEVSRVNHNFSVHGHTILTEGIDEGRSRITRKALPGFAEDSVQQVTLSQSVMYWVQEVSGRCPLGVLGCGGRGKSSDQRHDSRRYQCGIGSLHSNFLRAWTT